MSGNGSVYNSVYRTYITRGDAFGYREGNESSYQRDREFDLLNEDSHNSYEWFEVELMDNKSMGKGYIWEYVKCI